MDGNVKNFKVAYKSKVEDLVTDSFGICIDTATSVADKNACRKKAKDIMKSMGAKVSTLIKTIEKGIGKKTSST